MRAIPPIRMKFPLFFPALTDSSFLRSQRLWPNKQQGFSLVEVTLAIGIISFGMLSVIGMIPVGLSTIRHAIDERIEAQIAQGMKAEILLTPFSELSETYAKKTFHFDAEGKPTDQQGLSHFQVKTDLVAAIYPGATDEPEVWNAVRSVQVEISGIRDEMHRFAIIVPNSGD